MIIEHTQRFLNYFLDLQLVPDGIQGNKTNAAIRDAITKLQKKFAKEKLIWSTEFNFIGIRTSNEFTDLLQIGLFVLFMILSSQCQHQLSRG